MPKIDAPSACADSSSGAGVLAFVPDLWDAPPMSRHHVMKRLSEHRKVLWVSPPSYVEGWRRDGARKSFEGRGLEKVFDTFWAYAPRLPADYKARYPKSRIIAQGFRAYNRVWQRAFVRKIKALLARMGIDEVILYVWRPEFHWALGQFGEIATCYHVVDEYSFNTEQDVPISPEERKLIEGADVVLIHSKTLMEKKGHINPNTHCVPNGVDFEHYRSMIDAGAPEPEDLAGIPHPRIGYMGHIKRHIDLFLLCRIAEVRPDWSLVLVGPVRDSHEDIRDDVAALRALPNVHFLGSKPASELPRYVNGFDVATMPYRKTPYTHYIFPLKMHEYFACGKPVVATELVNLKEFGELLEFAESAQDWIGAIERVLVEENGSSARRIEAARVNSWDSRVEEINEYLKAIPKE